MPQASGQQSWTSAPYLELLQKNGIQVVGNSVGHWCGFFTALKHFVERKIPSTQPSPIFRDHADTFIIIFTAILTLRQETRKAL